MRNLKIIEKLPPGGDAVLYRVRSKEGREYCLKQARRWQRRNNEYAPLRDQAGVKPLYCRKKKHLTNEYQVAEKLNSTDAASPLPGVRAFVEHRFFCFEWGCDLLLDYVSGPDLGRQLAQQQRLDTEPLFHILIQAAHALIYVHSHGYLHLDVKPHNFILTEDKLFIIDLGSSAVIGTAPSDVTGTPGYISPEQLAADGDKRLSEKADIFAFGVMANVLAGGEALQQDEIMAMPAAERRREVSLVLKNKRTLLDLTHFRDSRTDRRALVDCVAKCTIPAPEARPDTMQDVVEQLYRIADAKGITLKPTLRPSERRT